MKKEFFATIVAILVAVLVLCTFICGVCFVFEKSVWVGSALLLLLIAGTAVIFKFSSEVVRQAEEEEEEDDEEDVSVPMDAFIEVHKKYRNKENTAVVCDDSTFIKAAHISRIDVDTFGTRIYVNEDGGRFIHVAETPFEIFDQMHKG